MSWWPEGSWRRQAPACASRAPVLEFGLEPASPNAYTFGYRVCCKVCLSISTYPAGLGVASEADAVCGAWANGGTPSS